MKNSRAYLSADMISVQGCIQLLVERSIVLWNLEEYDNGNIG